MVDFDPQVQIELIKIANDLMNKMSIGDAGAAFIKRRTEYFDQAYKALIKTVRESEKAPLTPQS